ncbi:unnamed protein product [Pleuronectes platessa]|uniref:Uncharacterized protein n=1 Tax=Pleuronectes platessa TaxID=8262 RepID=A0A9N7V3J5_PLEPL|nr:unnamed protein product [Pleuronectes platessa]
MEPVREKPRVPAVRPADIPPQLYGHEGCCMYREHVTHFRDELHNRASLSDLHCQRTQILLLTLETPSSRSTIEQVLFLAFETTWCEQGNQRTSTLHCASGISLEETPRHQPATRSYGKCAIYRPYMKHSSDNPHLGLQLSSIKLH